MCRPGKGLRVQNHQDEEIRLRRALLCTLLLSLPVAAAAMDECGKAACEARKGRWSCVQQPVPGDGSTHDFAVRSNSRDAAFICGQALTMRQGSDTGFAASCMLNPEQPPSIE